MNPPSLFRPDAQTRHLWRDVRLVTLDPAAGEGLGVIDDAVLAVGRDGAIQWLGPMASLDEGGLHDGVFSGDVHEGRGRWITPGLIDPHTHLVWGGQRADEFQQRQQGASYAEIAAAGTVFVNGPAGAYERAGAEIGTQRLWTAVASAPGTTAIGGGDTVASAARFVSSLRLSPKLTMVPPAGGLLTIA